MIVASVGPATTTARSSGSSATPPIATHVGDPLGQAPLHHHDPGAGVRQDVTEELALVRRVDRHLDRPELDRGEEAHDLLGRVLDEGGDPVAPGDPQGGEPVGDPVGGPVHVPGAQLHPVEVEVEAVGILDQARGQRVQHGGLGGSRRHGPDTTVRVTPGAPPDSPGASGHRVRRFSQSRCRRVSMVPITVRSLAARP